MEQSSASSGPEPVARIVEVGGKQATEREAVAECVVSMTPEACARLVAGTPKGNPLEAARIAGVMGVKRTPDLLPFCHPISVTGAEVVIDIDDANWYDPFTFVDGHSGIRSVFDMPANPADPLEIT